MTKDIHELRFEDIIDSREVIERIEELEGKARKSADEREELTKLRAFAEEAEGYAPDWLHGATFIRDSYFEEYARELAEDIGAIDPKASWPLTYIDWDAAADALKDDYSVVELDGVDFWTR